MTTRPKTFCRKNNPIKQTRPETIGVTIQPIIIFPRTCHFTAVTPCKIEIPNIAPAQQRSGRPLKSIRQRLKTKMKTVYSNQDKINKRISNEKAVCEKICNQQQKELQKSSSQVVILRDDSTDLKTMIDSVAVDIQALFARAEELDRNLKVLETKVDL